MEIDENHLIQHPIWLLNNLIICYQWESSLMAYNEKKTKITKKLAQTVQKAVFPDIIRRGTWLEETSIHKADILVFEGDLQRKDKR